MLWVSMCIKSDPPARNREISRSPAGCSSGGVAQIGSRSLKTNRLCASSKRCWSSAASKSERQLMIHWPVQQQVQVSDKSLASLPKGILPKGGRPFASEKWNNNQRPSQGMVGEADGRHRLRQHGDRCWWPQWWLEMHSGQLGLWVIWRYDGSRGWGLEMSWVLLFWHHQFYNSIFSPCFYVYESMYTLELHTDTYIHILW